MNIKHLGSKYGGWSVDLDSIKDGDFIIDAGIGEDLTFDIELSDIKNINIIGIDPTIKSHEYVQKINLKNLVLIKKAVWIEDDTKIKMYKNSNPDWVSESFYIDHANVSKFENYEIETISFRTLIEKYKPTLIKMDIEGAEYDVIKQCVGIKQICVEFHHTQIKNKNLNDTISMINFYEMNGYDVVHSSNNYQEVTFLKK